MKKILFILLSLIAYHLLLIANVSAVTPTVTVSSSETQINQLKDRIASRVAELKLVQRRGIVGTANEISDTQITLTDVQNNTRFVDVDELTKFASPSAKGSFGISDIGKGNTSSPNQRYH